MNFKVGDEVEIQCEVMHDFNLSGHGIGYKFKIAEIAGDYIRERIDDGKGVHFSLLKLVNTVRNFPTGAMRDTEEGKAHFVECLSFLAMARFGRYMLTCEGKYPPDNWRKGIPVKEYEQSMMRHIHKYFANKYEGASFEPEVDHLSAALFNLRGILHEEEIIRLKIKR